MYNEEPQFGDGVKLKDQSPVFPIKGTQVTGTGKA